MCKPEGPTPEQPLTTSSSIGMKHGVYWITKRVALGRFATPERAAVLQQQSVTHVLNVGEAASIITATEFGFAAVRDIPVLDLERIPDATAIEAINLLHEMLLVPDSRIFIHCVAGQNRSPTILWLYLIACGMSAEDASVLITDRSPDSVPGHSLLVDAALVEMVQSHGVQQYQPLSDETILEPAS